MRRIAAILACIALAACGDANPFNGPVRMAVDQSTNNQTAEVAENDSLPHSVDAVLWRGRDGGLSLRLVTPAYAQTEVDGAPVAGGLVNSVPMDGRPLVAWNPTALTDANGRAKFWYDPGTKTGRYCAEIRFADGDTRMVTDSVCANVVAGPPVAPTTRFNASGGTPDPWRHPEVNTAAISSTLTDAHGNPTAAYRVEADGWLQPLNDGLPVDAYYHHLAVTCDVQFGDTTGVRFYGLDGTLLVDGLAQMQHIQFLGPPPADSVYHQWNVSIRRRSEPPLFPYERPDSAFALPHPGVPC